LCQAPIGQGDIRVNLLDINVQSGVTDHTQYIAYFENFSPDTLKTA